MSDYWDDEFSAYDIDKLGKKDNTSADSEGLDAQEPEPTATEPVLAANTVSGEISSATDIPAPKQEDPAPLADNDGSEENPWWTDERISAKAPFAAKPLTTEDLQLMAAQQEAAASTVGELLQQTMQIMENAVGKRMPRGLRTTAAFLRDTHSVLTATKALITTYINIGVKPLFQTVKHNRLKSTATVTANTLNAHADTMREGFADLTAMMAETDDRPSLNLRTRIIKGQATVIFNFAEEQAAAFLATMNAFPPKGGALLLLALLSSEHDEDAQTAIDDTLRLANSPLPLAADAPAMLKAIQKRDEQTIYSLVQKTADARSKRQQIIE